MTAITRIALIGFGEVGVRLAQDLARAGASKITAFDTRFIDRNSPASRNLAQAEVAITGSALEAARGAQLIISAVTADQDVVAARSVTGGIEAGAYFMALNSASPGCKQESAALIEAAGGRYVEAAVMSPIDPKRIASPMLLGGPHAADFLKDAAGIGFAGATVYADTVGPAAATKLCRSVMIKGVEALLTESLLAARHYGVEEEVLASLSNLLPLPDWNATATYMISRSLEHGGRRAEEMREAAQTVREAGLPALMSVAIAQRQDLTAPFADALTEPNLTAMLDHILKEIGSP